jgi:hypothetical protein
MGKCFIYFFGIFSILYRLTWRPKKASISKNIRLHGCLKVVFFFPKQVLDNFGLISIQYEKNLLNLDSVWMDGGAEPT